MIHKKPLIAPRFICRHADMRRDSFNYRDAPQYMCKHRDGSTQAAIPSMLPELCLLFGALLATCVVFGLWIGYHKPDAIAWHRVYGAAVVSGFLLSVPIAAWLGKFSFMVAVGPRQYKGRRVLWGEADVTPEWERDDDV